MFTKLCLGTVQLGLKYGIKNEIGRQPTNKESFLVLQTAIDNGVTCFDTASTYGNAENILGKFGIGKYDVKVISKMKPNLIKECSGGIIESVQHEVERSIQRMGVQFLDGYLLHDAKDFYHADIMKGLQICKDKGLVKHIGVSIYEPEDAIIAVKSGRMDYIQIPYNVFDQRLDRTDFFEIAEKKQVEIFARSAFLQGLLLMDIDNITRNLLEAKPYLKKFNDIVDLYGYSRAEAAFLFSYCHAGINRVVFGVDTKQQLIDNLAIVEKAKGFKTCYDDLTGAFNDVDRKIIIPSLWN